MENGVQKNEHMSLILEALENILKVGERHNKDQFEIKVEEAGVIEILETIQAKELHEISNIATRLIMEYFAKDGSNNETQTSYT